jgi:hypothetical protein
MDVVRGLLETTVYGSRMDSIYDRRVLSQFIVANFPADKFPLFQIPNDITIKAITHLLSQCSLEDGPELLGLRANANATVARSMITSTLKNLSLLSSAASNESQSDTSTFQLASQFTAQYPGVTEEVQVSLQDHPAIDFLSVQRETAHRLLKTVTTDIDALNSSGDSAMLPAHLRSVSAALKKNGVPTEWQIDWLDIDGFDEWIEQLFIRTAALDALAMRVRDHAVLTSQPIPLFATMRPRAFVSALLQTAVRMKKVELNSLKIVATFERPPPSAIMTLNVCDLALQVAMLKNGAVAPSTTPNDDIMKLEKVLFSICPIETSTVEGPITLPIFENLARERFVAEVEVPAVNPTEVLLSSAAFVFNG